MPTEWTLFGFHGMVVIMILTFVIGAGAIILMAFTNYNYDASAYTMGSGRLTDKNCMHFETSFLGKLFY